MNLDEWMTVWKSQDAVPEHDVNENLLQRALRQEEAKLQKARWRERWIRYALSAFVAGLLALLLTLMIYAHQRFMMTGWDYVLGIGGVVAALIAAGSVYVGHRTQARREQVFGGSLRDQINRRITQLDYEITGVSQGSVVYVLMGVICPLAILHLGLRVNHKSLGDVSWVPVALLIMCFWAGTRSRRRVVQQATARKRDLEALLRELDGQ